MDAVTLDLLRVIIVIGGAALSVFIVALLVRLYEAATEAKEWFERENQSYREDEVGNGALYD